MIPRSPFPYEDNDWEQRSSPGLDNVTCSLRIAIVMPFLSGLSFNQLSPGQVHLPPLLCSASLLLLPLLCQATPPASQRAAPLLPLASHPSQRAHLITVITLY